MAATAAATTTSTSNNDSMFDLSELPSLKDGSMKSIEEESMKRRKTCRFIEEAGRILGLPRVAVSTAMVFFHRFYAKHSFKNHDRFEVAVACIVLAGKTEESPRKLNKVMDECYKLKLRGMQAGRISTTSTTAAGAGGKGGSPSSPSSPSLDVKSEEFFKLKERILLLERVILHTIGFELSVDHPYKFLIEQSKKLVHARMLEYITPPTTSGGNMSSSQLASKMSNELVQYAMNFANDSMQTSLCLQFEPQRIATATVFLAANFGKIRPAAGKDWLQILAPTNSQVLSPYDVQALASIVMQIIELVLDRKGADPAMFQQIRRELDSLQQMSDKGSNTSAITASSSAAAAGGGKSTGSGSKQPQAAAAAAALDQREAKRPRIE